MGASSRMCPHQGHHRGCRRDNAGRRGVAPALYGISPRLHGARGSPLLSLTFPALSPSLAPLSWLAIN